MLDIGIQDGIFIISFFYWMLTCFMQPRHHYPCFLRERTLEGCHPAPNESLQCFKVVKIFIEVKSKLFILFPYFSSWRNTSHRKVFVAPSKTCDTWFSHLQFDSVYKFCAVIYSLLRTFILEQFPMPKIFIVMLPVIEYTSNNFYMHQPYAYI